MNKNRTEEVLVRYLLLPCFILAAIGTGILISTQKDLIYVDYFSVGVLGILIVVCLLLLVCYRRF